MPDQYEVKYKIRVPKSRNPQTGAVKYQNSGYASTPLKIKASSPEEAKKIAAKHEKVAKAKIRAAKGLDYDMPKPRVQMSVTRISGKGGGGGGIMTPDGNSSGLKGLPKGMTRKFNKGGSVKKKK